MYDELYKKNPAVFGASSLNFLEKIVPQLNVQKGNALDVGCGEGNTSEYLAKIGFTVDALDISEHAFSAIKNIEKVSTHMVGVAEFPLQKQYDFVYYALMLHHLSKAEGGAVLAKEKACTNVGGIHALRIFTTNSIFSTQSQGRNFYDDGSNLNALYGGWDIVHDEMIISQAATADIQNEMREVVFKKRK